MRDCRVCVQHLTNLLCIWHFVVMLIVYLVLNPCVAGDISHALAVCAVSAYQELVPGANDTCKYRLHSKCSTSLHQHCRVLVFGYMGQF